MCIITLVVKVFCIFYVFGNSILKSQVHMYEITLLEEKFLLNKFKYFEKFEDIWIHPIIIYKYFCGILSIFFVLGQLT